MAATPTSSSNGNGVVASPAAPSTTTPAPTAGQETLLSKMLSTLVSRFLSDKGLLTGGLVATDGIKLLLAGDPVLNKIGDAINKV